MSEKTKKTWEYVLIGIALLIIAYLYFSQKPQTQAPPETAVRPMTFTSPDGVNYTPFSFGGFTPFNIKIPGFTINNIKIPPICNTFNTNNNSNNNNSCGFCPASNKLDNYVWQ